MFTTTEKLCQSQICHVYVVCKRSTIIVSQCFQRERRKFFKFDTSLKALCALLKTFLAFLFVDFSSFQQSFWNWQWGRSEQEVNWQTRKPLGLVKKCSGGRSFLPKICTFFCYRQKSLQNILGQSFTCWKLNSFQIFCYWSLLEYFSKIYYN